MDAVREFYCEYRKDTAVCCKVLSLLQVLLKYLLLS